MQITKSQFKKLILFQAVLLFVYVIASFFTPALLPAELQTYLDSVYEQDLSIYEIITAVLALPLLVWMLQNLVALYQFRSYAPKHLLYITMISVLLYISIPGAIVYTVIDSFLNDLLFLLAGFTLAIVFYSNIADEFKKPVEKNTPTV
ncbi:hypothetical protein K2P47_01820 [Patescibacteria group bacterium]|nr:hypothetical protein [Patescibacteria group bacterium]